MSNHFVPHKSPIPILNKSTMNPTERKTVKRNLNIDTLFRKNYYKTESTHFLYTLPEPINNVVSMKIASVEIPHIWYTFSAADKSNEFTIHIYNYVDMLTNEIYTFSQVFYIPEGNYGSGDLVTSMNNYLSNLAGVFSHFYFEVDSTSTKTIIRIKTPVEEPVVNDVELNKYSPDFYFEVDFRIQSDPTRPIYKNAGWMMGFKESLYRVVYDPSGFTNYIYLNQGTETYRYYLMSESSYGNSMVNYFFIDVDDFHKNYAANMHLSSTADSYIGNTIMGRVQVISGFNTILTNTSNDYVFKTREYFGPIKLEKLLIRIINRFGDVININGNDYSMLLEIEQLYSQ